MLKEVRQCGPTLTFYDLTLLPVSFFPFFLLTVLDDSVINQLLVLLSMFSLTIAMPSLELKARINLFSP